MTHMVQNTVYVWNWVELSTSELELSCLTDLVPESELEWNCFHRNWNWSGIVFIGIAIGIELPSGFGTRVGIGVELSLSEFELEWNYFYRNLNWNWIAFKIWYRIRNWSGIAFIEIGIGVELFLSELELELNCKNWIDPTQFRSRFHEALRLTKAGLSD